MALEAIQITHTIPAPTWPKKPATLHVSLDGRTIDASPQDVEDLIARLKSGLDDVKLHNQSAALSQAMGFSKEPKELHDEWLANAAERARQAQEAERAERARITEERNAKNRAAYEKRQAEEHARWAARAERIKAEQEAAK